MWGKVRLLFERQVLHFVFLVILLSLVLVASIVGGFLTGSYLNISTSTWFYIALAIPIIHQVFVWFVWRTQLHFSLITKLLGQAGFKTYSIVFFILFISRLLFIIILALANKNSLNFNQLILSGLAVIILIPSVYLLRSVLKYFGYKRALGIDHFDLSYRHKPLVREGIFRLTSNAMYVFGFMILWIPGLLYSSSAALIVALFNHIYIWIHYYFTEKPDMERIYGSRGSF
jgi:hypothetical protein